MITHCGIELSQKKRESFQDGESFPFLLFKKVAKRKINYGGVSGKRPDLAIELL